MFYESFCKHEKRGEHTFFAGGSSGLSLIKQSRKEANPSLSSTATARKTLISQPLFEQAALQQEKGPLTQVIRAAGPEGLCVSTSHLCGL